MHEILIIVGTILPTISVGIYVRSILQGHTRPHRTTYMMLSMITGLAFISLLAAGDTSGVWLAAVSFAQCLLVLVLSVRFGMGGKDPFDMICMALCGLGITAWILTGESFMGLLASIVADFLAVLPTLRKAWRHPTTEPWLFYAIDALASVVILLAGPYALRNGLYPLYLLLVNALCAVIIIISGRLVRRRKLT